MNEIVLDQQDVPGLKEVGDALYQIGHLPSQEEDQLVELVVVVVHLLGPAVFQVEEAEILVQIPPLAGGLPNAHGGSLLSRFVTSILAHFLSPRNSNIQQTWKKIFRIFGGSGKKPDLRNRNFGQTGFLKSVIVIGKIFWHIHEDQNRPNFHTV